MDNEKAKFILQSFRPDGADASDADFAEALEHAARDRELGEWLAAERAADAQFASALGLVEIPEELRQHILSVMRGEKPGDPELDREMDALLQSGLADVQPPEGLRDQILAAMTIQSEDKKVTPMPTKKTISIRRFLSVASVAAALVLGVFLALQLTSDDDKLLATYDVQQTAGQLLNAKFQFDEKSENIANINTWLVSNDLPSSTQLPSGLKELKSMGCKKIILPGDKFASLVCFSSDSEGSVHLVIVKNEDVKDSDLPAMDKVREEDCYHCPKTDWNVARWKDSEHTFILMSRNEKARKNELLRYF
ncbi:MAG: hypothetical protein AB8F34_00800 [Akkermansiaceae bacterium]